MLSSVRLCLAIRSSGLERAETGAAAEAVAFDVVDDEQIKPLPLCRD